MRQRFEGLIMRFENSWNHVDPTLEFSGELYIITPLLDPEIQLA
jgi:hypothetical protein